MSEVSKPSFKGDICSLLAVNYNNVVGMLMMLAWQGSSQSSSIEMLRIDAALTGTNNTHWIMYLR